MALFYFTIGVSDNTFSLKEKLEKIRYEGANISYTIISSSHVILKINEVELNVQYELSKSSIARYFWYLCDAYNQESLIILCDSPNVNENGKTGTFGLSTYNRAYFRYKEKMIEVPLKEDTFSDRFNLIKGNFNTFDDETIGNNLVTSKCTFNSGSNIDNGEIISIDNLYVSAGLQDIDFRTIIKDSKGNTFINIGGIFYANNVDYVVADSTCPNLILVPDGRIKYEWNANTEIVNDIWLNTEKTASIKLGTHYKYEVKNNSFFMKQLGWNTSIKLSLPDDVNGFTFYSILRCYKHYGLNDYSYELPGLEIGNNEQERHVIAPLHGGEVKYLSSNILNNIDGKLGLFTAERTNIKNTNSDYPRFIFPSYDEINHFISDEYYFYTFGLDISNIPLLLYVFRCSKSKNLSYDNPPRFSIFVKDKKFYDNLLTPYSINEPKKSSIIDLKNINIVTTTKTIGIPNTLGEIKYIGLQPRGDISDEEILENMQYLTKKFKLDKEG